MCQTELAKEQIDAASAFLELFNQQVPVDVAFWMKVTESPSWYLYGATQAIEGADPRQAYREVTKIVGVRNYWLDVFRIRLISPGERTAKLRKYHGCAS